MAVQLQFTPNTAVQLGDFAAGAKVSFFEGGTTNPLITYTDEALTTPHPTVVEADASGRFPPVWTDGTMEARAVVTASDDTTIDTFDPVFLAGANPTVASEIGFSPVPENLAGNVQEAIANNTSSKAPKADPAFTGTPTTPTAAVSDNSNQIASTAFVKAQLASPAFTGTPTAPTPSTDSDSTQIPTTEWVNDRLPVGAVFVGPLQDVDGTTYSEAHGLGVVPFLLQIEAICQTADAPYAVGDVIFPDPNQSTSGSSNFNVLYADDTNVVFTPNDATPFPILPTAARWQYRIRAFGGNDAVGSIVNPLHRGNVSVSTAADLESAINNHDGSGVITVTGSSTLTMTGMLTPIAKELDIRADTLGGPTIVGNWTFNNFTGMYMSGFNLEPLDPADQWLRTNMAAVEFNDCQFDGSAVTANPMASCVFSNMRFRATDRDCTFTLGTGGSQGFDFDSSCNIKVNGNSGAFRVRMTTQAANAMIVLDQSSLVADGLFVSGTAGLGVGIGINARRRSDLVLQGSGNNGITFLERGIIARQGSTGEVAGTTLSGNTTAIQFLSGGWMTQDKDTNTFSANTTDVDNDQQTDGELLAPFHGLSPAVLQFSSGGETLASGGTYYLGVAHFNTNATFARFPCPYDGVIKNFYVQMSSTPGTGENYQIEVMDGSSATGVTVTISDTNNSASDLVNTRTVSAGDLISIRVITSAGASARAVSCSFEIQRT